VTQKRWKWVAGPWNRWTEAIKGGRGTHSVYHGMDGTRQGKISMKNLFSQVLRPEKECVSCKRHFTHTICTHVEIHTQASHEEEGVKLPDLNVKWCHENPCAPKAQSVLEWCRPALEVLWGKFQGQREWNRIDRGFSAMKCHTVILYSAKLLPKCEVKRYIFPHSKGLPEWRHYENKAASWELHEEAVARISRDLINEGEGNCRDGG
jgi:hypothetical protein